MRVRRRGVLALVLVAVSAACDRGPAPRWPAEITENFLHGCRSRATDAQCRCALARLQERFSLEEFQRLEREAAGGTVPKALADAVSGCAGS